MVDVGICLVSVSSYRIEAICEYYVEISIFWPKGCWVPEHVITEGQSHDILKYFKLAVLSFCTLWAGSYDFYISIRSSYHDVG
jgi:hypothetical protein